MKKSILIVEDNIDYITQYIQLLKRYNLLITQSYAEAKKILLTENKNINLVITDWELNDSLGDGIDLIQFIRNNTNSNIKALPILMATSYTSDNKLDEAFGEGVDDYIRKPIYKKEILARTEAIFRKKIFMQKIKILLASANPSGTGFLQVNKEFRLIKDKLTKSGKDRELFEVEFELELTKSNLFDNLINYQPNIIHFSGHGARNLLHISDDSGQAVPLENFPDIINHFAKNKNIKCIIVNACNSYKIVKQINNEDTLAIGTNVPILDSKAIEFSQGFYLALASGKSVEEAFNVGLLYSNNTDDYMNNFKK